MHRIDTPTAQKDKFGAGKNGFTRGNPQTGTPATDLDDDYFDMLQEELAGVVEASGVNLEKSKHNQLLTALKALLLSRAHPFADIKADGAAAIAEALSNLGLGNAKFVTTRGRNASGEWIIWSDGAIEVFGTSAAIANGIATVNYPVALPLVSKNIAIQPRSAADPGASSFTTTVIDSGVTASGFTAKNLFSATGANSSNQFSYRVYSAAS